jgi:SAM-dependent methyltransferase
MNHNSYVFDFEKNSFLGNFEDMYKKDKDGEFDSWEQDSMSLYKKIDLSIINEYNFENIIDLGCGKGYFTNLLKKRNNNTYGCDISETAIDIAKSKFQNIEFDSLDISNLNELSKYLANKTGGASMVVSRATLYYLKNWKEVIKTISKDAKYVIFGLNIPPKTIAFIKSENEFIEEFSKNFEIVEYIKYQGRDSFSILGRSLNK